MKRELILVAQEEELESFLEKLSRKENFLGRSKYPGDGFTVITTGIGRTNAAAVCSAALQESDYDKVVNVGFGGALPDSGLEIGDIVGGRKAIHADLGIETPSGFGDLRDLGFRTTPNTYNTFKMSPIADLPLRNIATVSTVSASDERAREIRERFNADVETMETAAVSQTALIYGVDVSAVVGVSNYAGSTREFNADEPEKGLSSALEEIYL